MAKNYKLIFKGDEWRIEGPHGPFLYGPGPKNKAIALRDLPEIEREYMLEQIEKDFEDEPGSLLASYSPNDEIPGSK